MSILDKVGHDTISRLGRAASQRFAEAECLREEKHFLSALYFYGYVAEIVIGAAYFRSKGYKAKDEISRESLRRALCLARPLSEMSDKSHPFDGLARLLIEEKATLYLPAYPAVTVSQLQTKVANLSANWSPKLRYRAIHLKEDQILTIRDDAQWFLKNFSKL